MGPSLENRVRGHIILRSYRNIAEHFPVTGVACTTWRAQERAESSKAGDNEARGVSTHVARLGLFDSKWSAEQYGRS